METVGALLAGGFIGAVLGFVGAGGAMLSVPILIYIFSFTSVIFMNTTVNIFIFIQNQRIFF